MSMPQDIVDKFQTLIDDWLTGIATIADRIFGEGDNEDKAFLQSNVFFAHCLFRTPMGSYLNVPSSISLYWSIDVQLEDNNVKFGNLTYLGKDNNNWSDAAIEQMQAAVKAEYFNVSTDDTGNLYVQISSDARFTLYSGGVYYDQKVHLHCDNPDSYYHAVVTNGFSVRTGQCTYTIDEQGRCITNLSYPQSHPSSNNNLMYAIKTFPIVGNIKDTTNINNFIGAQGATNNYQTTYTTQGGYSFKVYYGDNYIITNAVGDNVSYNDIKNAVQTAVNQINDDNDTDISVPDYPAPAPPVTGDDDIEVDMSLNDAAYGAGMSHYYVTTTTSGVLDDISAAMSTWNINNTGKDLYRNLLSCRLTKVGPIPAENSTFVIYGEELQYNGAPISISKITGNPSMDLGEYEILPKFNDFRDYAPYTKIEMYIPYCGWVALPSHCMSSEDKPKIITGTLLCDIIAGTCKAVIKCNDTVVAEAAGFTAIDVPFVGENVGMKMAGIASSITSYGSNAAKTVGGIAGGISGGGPAGAAAAGGVVSLLGSFAQLNAAFNANYTEICGKTGDGCNVAGLNKVYIKIQRPKTGGFEEPDFVPGDYGHTTGFLCMKKLKVSDCSGLIIAANADVSGIGSATDAERAEIKRVLETGLFVNSPPESGE